MHLQTNNDTGEAVPKRKGRRMSKREWRRKHWIVCTEGQTLEARAIKQTMRGPKLLSNAMPRVMPDVEKLREAGVAVGQFSKLRWQRPTKHFNDRVGQRRTQNWNCDCEVPCVFERRVLKDRRSRSQQKRKPDKYLFNSVRVDPINHTSKVKKPQLIFAESALGPPLKEVTALSVRREASATAPKIRTS